MNVGKQSLNASLNENPRRDSKDKGTSKGVMMRPRKGEHLVELSSG
jgi:hypothetical protein